MGDRPLYLPDLVAAWATSPRGDAVYLDELDGRSLTWRDADAEATAWAGMLAAAGIGDGDRVLTMLPTVATAITVWSGVARLGAVEVPVNGELVGALLDHVVSTADARVAIVAKRHLATIVPALRRAGTAVLAVPDVATDDPDVISISEHFSAVHCGVPAPSAAPVPERQLEPWDTAIILFTSGTTGPSKGVLVPWGQLDEVSRGSMPFDDLGADDVYYCPFGMAHVTGRSAAYLMALLGGRLVLKERFSTSTYWSDITRAGCTTTVMMGTMAHFLAQQPRSPGDADTTLRNVLMAPLIPEVGAFAERFGLRICTVFNMTEISSPITSQGWQLDASLSCGTVRPGFDCRVVDEHDEQVPDGTVGELVVRSDQPWKLMAGYFREPAKTAEAWRNLWFHTGDAFSREGEGRFVFRDRFKDVIRRRGENISSVELEAQVCSHPGIAAAAAIGVPSSVGEEDVAVFVVRAPGASLDGTELVAYLDGAVPRYMVPRYVEFVDALPMTATEKLDKKSLRARGVSGEAFDREAQRGSSVVGSG